MADITEERLRYHATRSWTAFDPATYDELHAMSIELLAAREKIRADEEHLPKIGVLTRDLYETEQELRAARAQLHADDQRAWESLGHPEGAYETTHVQRLCAEVQRLRAALREALSGADLREALSLLRNIDWDKDNWDERYEALLAKHKETP